MEKTDVILGQTKEDIFSLKDLGKSIQTRVIGSSRFHKFQKTYRNDRIAFMHDAFPSYSKTIALYQEEILGYFDEGHNRVSVRGPHGLGKTFLASILVHHAVLTAPDDCKVPTTASAWRQLEKYLWPEIKKAAHNLAWPVIGRDRYDPLREMLTMSIRLKGGLVEAFALSSDNHHAIEGAHATWLMYILDEAKVIPVPMWDAIEGAFSTEGLARNVDVIDEVTQYTEPHKGDAKKKSDKGLQHKAKAGDFIAEAFAISTPGDPAGRFFDIHSGAVGYEDWYTRHVTLDEAIDAGRVSQSWADQRKKQWGEDSSTYQNRVLGEFADSSEEGIIPLTWIKAAQDRWKEWDEGGRVSQQGAHTVGVDIARYGGDLTVFAFRQGSVLSTIRMFSNLSTTVTAQKLTELYDGANIHIETDGGLGAAVYDMLVDRGIRGVRSITVGAAAWGNDRTGTLSFANVRAAMWWNMREMLDPYYSMDIALHPNEYLQMDLITPKWDIIKDGVILLEAKKEIKKRLGRSTDYGDACCLAFWLGGGGGGVVF